MFSLAISIQFYFFNLSFRPWISTSSKINKLILRWRKLRIYGNIALKCCCFIQFLLFVATLMANSTHDFVKLNICSMNRHLDSSGQSKAAHSNSHNSMLITRKFASQHPFINTFKFRLRSFIFELKLSHILKRLFLWNIMKV